MSFQLTCTYLWFCFCVFFFVSFSLGHIFLSPKFFLFCTRYHTQHEIEAPDEIYHNLGSYRIGRSCEGNGYFGVTRDWAGVSWDAGLLRSSLPLVFYLLYLKICTLNIFRVWLFNLPSHAGSNSLKGRPVLCFLQILLLLAEFCLLSTGRLNNFSLLFWLGPHPSVLS